MSNVYQEQKRKSVLLFAAGTLAVGAAVALIIYFAYILNLRTEYRAVCIEINDCVLTSQMRSDGRIEMGEKSCALNAAGLQYYNIFLLDGKTVVYNRREFSPDEKCLNLYFSGCRLSFRELRDGFDIGVRWETPEKTVCYSVASGNISFQQLSAYFTNLYNREQKAG